MPNELETLFDQSIFDICSELNIDQKQSSGIESGYWIPTDTLDLIGDTDTDTRYLKLRVSDTGHPIPKKACDTR